MSELSTSPGLASVAVIGGGLAGLATAVRLREAGLVVELFEARRRLGGRAGSFLDPASKEWVDYCQHVGMACCTNLADFCRRIGVADRFTRYSRLHFFGPDGRRHDLAGSRWLPAPLHLAPSLLRLGYLSWRERISVARAMLRLARTPAQDSETSPTIGEWLQAQGQSPRAMELFWGVVLVSALGEKLERASLTAARKVFVDGFLSNRGTYQVDVPQAPLSEIFGESIGTWLRERGAAIHVGAEVARLHPRGERIASLELADGSRRDFDQFVVALPWRRVNSVLPVDFGTRIPELSRLGEIEASPITGIHLWFDRSFTDLPHAVLVGRLSQWLFNRARGAARDDLPGEHYYQVVISASRDISSRSRDEVLMEVLDDLRTVWPAARSAKPLRSRVVTEHEAVFSARPGLDELRPLQRTPISNLFLAGDWTRTGWPSTMESAVRSGYLAAEGVLAALRRPTSLLAPDLPREWLARWLLGRVTP